MDTSTKQTLTPDRQQKYQRAQLVDTENDTGKQRSIHFRRVVYHTLKEYMCLLLKEVF